MNILHGYNLLPFILSISISTLECTCIKTSLAFIYPLLSVLVLVRMICIISSLSKQVSSNKNMCLCSTGLKIPKKQNKNSAGLITKNYYMYYNGFFCYFLKSPESFNSDIFFNFDIRSIIQLYKQLPSPGT